MTAEGEIDVQSPRVRVGTFTDRKAVLRAIFGIDPPFLGSLCNEAAGAVPLYADGRSFFGCVQGLGVDNDCSGRKLDGPIVRWRGEIVVFTRPKGHAFRRVMEVESEARVNRARHPVLEMEVVLPSPSFSHDFRLAFGAHGKVGWKGGAVANLGHACLQGRHRSIGFFVQARRAEGGECRGDRAGNQGGRCSPFLGLEGRDAKGVNENQGDCDRNCAELPLVERSQESG